MGGYSKPVLRKLDELRVVAEEIAGHSEQIKRRDALIRDLSKTVPKKDLAVIAGVSRMRVSQISA